MLHDQSVEPKKSIIRIIIFGLYEEEFEEHDPEYISFDVFNAIVFILRKINPHYAQLFQDFIKNHRFINWQLHLLVPVRATLCDSGTDRRTGSILPRLRISRCAVRLRCGHRRNGRAATAAAWPGCNISDALGCASVDRASVPVPGAAEQYSATSRVAQRRRRITKSPNCAGMPTIKWSSRKNYYGTKHYIRTCQMLTQTIM